MKGEVQLMGSAVSLVNYAEAGQYFCFRLVSGITSLVMQGLTVDDMMDWASTLYHAIAVANGGAHLLDIERNKVKMELAAQEEARERAEQERIKAEEERVKAEAETAKAEEERAQAEEERAKAEEERAKAEEERAKAEEERVKAEEERVKAEQERAKAEQDERERLALEAAEAAERAEQERLAAEEVRTYFYAC
jgi:flagellar biosynthesis GTPase FlhF